MCRVGDVRKMWKWDEGGLCIIVYWCYLEVEEFWGYLGFKVGIKFNYFICFEYYILRILLGI